MNCRDKHGRTPLILAAKGRHAGHHGVVEILISMGADLDAVFGANRMTALHMAVAYRRTSIASLLVRSGASPFLESTAGLTAHDMVIREGLSIDLLRLIESRGLYAGWLSLRVGGYRRPWARRWVVVSQRLVQTDRGSNARVRVMLSCYPHLQTFGCVCRTWLCGSRLACSGLSVDLVLAPHVQKPKGAKCRRLGGRWVLEFRAAEEGQRDLEEFKDCMNWASGLGAEGGLPALPASPGGGQQHWANVPPTYLAETEASGISLASTTSTFESQESDLIPAVSLEGGDDGEGLAAAGSAVDAVGGECLMCLDRRVEYVYLHGESCCAVACEVCNVKYQSDLCPVCRRRITARIKVYGL